MNHLLNKTYPVPDLHIQRIFDRFASSGFMEDGEEDKEFEG